uniref:MARVEL domain-containing protein n=1 Tax=Spermophilus dauricus TaxID=99837 RepID=A0A8C9QJC7_SPEDA
AASPQEFCIYNRNASACSYGVAVGVLAFLTCLLYLALDVYFPQISSVKDRKKAVLSDIAFWAFLWFVGFCYLANQWQGSKPKDNPLNEGTDAARAAIAFSFFSIFTWVSTAPTGPAPRGQEPRAHLVPKMPGTPGQGTAGRVRPSLAHSFTPCPFVRSLSVHSLSKRLLSSYLVPSDELDRDPASQEPPGWEGKTDIRTSPMGCRLLEGWRLVHPRVCQGCPWSKVLSCRHRMISVSTVVA